MHKNHIVAVCATTLLSSTCVQIVFSKNAYYLYDYMDINGSAFGDVPNERSTDASFAISTIFDILTANLAASSKSDTGNIFKPEEAINTFPSSTFVPCFVSYAMSISRDSGVRVYSVGSTQLCN